MQANGVVHRDIKPDNILLMSPPTSFDLDESVDSNGAPIARLPRNNLVRQQREAAEREQALLSQRGDTKGAALHHRASQDSGTYLPPAVGVPGPSGVILPRLRASSVVATTPSSSTRQQRQSIDSGAIPSGSRPPVSPPAPSQSFGGPANSGKTAAHPYGPADSMQTAGHPVMSESSDWGGQHSGSTLHHHHGTSSTVYMQAMPPWVQGESTEEFTARWRQLNAEYAEVLDQPAPPDAMIGDFTFAVQFGNGRVLSEPCGTPYYLAPEILEVSYTKRNTSYPPTVDMWSLGVSAFTLLCGSAPFNGQDKLSLFKMILASPLKYRSRCWDTISEDARSFLEFIMVRDPYRRPTPELALGHPWIKGHIRMKEELAVAKLALRTAVEAKHRADERVRAQQKLQMSQQLLSTPGSTSRSQSDVSSAMVSPPRVAHGGAPQRPSLSPSALEGAMTPNALRPASVVAAAAAAAAGGATSGGASFTSTSPSFARPPLVASSLSSVAWQQAYARGNAGGARPSLGGVNSPPGPMDPQTAVAAPLTQHPVLHQVMEAYASVCAEMGVAPLRSVLSATTIQLGTVPASCDVALDEVINSPNGGDPNGTPQSHAMPTSPATDGDWVSPARVFQPLSSMTAQQQQQYSLNRTRGSIISLGGCESPTLAAAGAVAVGGNQVGGAGALIAAAAAAGDDAMLATTRGESLIFSGRVPGSTAAHVGTPTPGLNDGSMMGMSPSFCSLPAWQYNPNGAAASAAGVLSPGAQSMSMTGGSPYAPTAFFPAGVVTVHLRSLDEGNRRLGPQDVRALGEAMNRALRPHGGPPSLVASPSRRNLRATAVSARVLQTYCEVFVHPPAGSAANATVAAGAALDDATVSALADLVVSRSSAVAHVGIAPSVVVAGTRSAVAIPNKYNASRAAGVVVGGAVTPSREGTPNGYEAGQGNALELVSVARSTLLTELASPTAPSTSSPAEGAPMWVLYSEFMPWPLAPYSRMTLEQ
jgi:serine/threonine protein kinase